MKNNILFAILTIIAACSLTTMALGFINIKSVFELIFNTIAHLILLVAIYGAVKDFFRKD